MASRNSSLSPRLLLWLSILFITSRRKASSSPPLLLSLNCTPPPHPTPQNNKPIEILLSKLIAGVTRTRFATSTVNLNQDRFDGLMQCRLNTSSNDCTFCVRTAQRTVSTLCSESEAVAAWFDGCYLQYYNYYKFSRAIYVPKSTSSNQTSVTRQALQFEEALGVLLLQLRVRIGLTSSRGFVSKEVRYGDDGSRIYGLAECVRSVSSKECEVCVLEATEMLYQCCNGRAGVVVAAGNCIIRFENYRSYGSGDAGGSDSGGWSAAGGASEVVNIYDESEHHEGSWGLQTKVAWAWGVGVACLLGFVLGAWLLRRKVLNTAKVATISGSSEVEHKDLA